MICQLFQLAKNQRAVSPGAGEGYIEVVATTFSLECGLSLRPIPAVICDPVAKLATLAFEFAAGGAGVIPLIQPFSCFK